MTNIEDGLYHKASLVVDNWLENHAGETFDLDTICRQLEIHDAAKRNIITIKLAYEVKRGTLEKQNRTYKYINRERKLIAWNDAEDGDELSISWPRSHTDGSRFSFDGRIIVRPRDEIVVAGLSNWGKSTFARNFLAENLDAWDGKIQMMVNEYSPGRFKGVLNRMSWISFVYNDNTPRFTLIERHDDWKYAIEPDWINIIDWVSLTDNFYLIRSIMEGIQETLRNGIALIVLQKREGKDLGEGGGMTEDRAAAYFNIDSGRLSVRKVKEWKGMNPQGISDGFAVVDGGAQFANIRPVKLCPKCGGKKTCWVKGEGQITCPDCGGSGFKDK